MRGIDEVNVTRWLTEHVEELEAPFTFDLIAGGRSNLTYSVTAANGRRVVLRRPPLGHVLATAHDMAREFRIISAVASAGVPVAPALGLCTDDEVNGAPFYVMGYVPGVVLDSPEAAAALEPAERSAACGSLVEVLAHLHSIEPDDVGLGDLARREAYIERQLKRWSTQWSQSKQRELPEVDEVERRLRSGVPPQVRTGIAHGDYRFGNCMVDPTAGRIAAVLDWELCTLGDVLADVGYLCVYWADERGQSRANDPTSATGFWTRQQVLDRYAELTGADLSGIGYYVAFSSWRLAVISEGVYARYRHGVMGDVDDAALDGFRAGTEQLARAALAALGG